MTPSVTQADVTNILFCDTIHIPKNIVITSANYSTNVTKWLNASDKEGVLFLSLT